MPIRAGALFSCRIRSYWSEQLPRKQQAAGSIPADGTIAAGSAYPAQLHAEGEPRQQTVVSPKERGLFMKREDVKAKLPGITDEQLNWLMSENGADINREKTVAEQFKTKFENAQAQLKTAQDGLAKFDGKKTPDEYEAELTKLRGDMQAQADGFAFDSALNTAIMGKKGRSVKAVRALLDVDALKSSKDRSTDIDKALEEAAKANPWAFGEAAEGGVRVSSGAEHGTPPTGDTDAVTAAFKAMNPGIKID